jgi:two-component system, response regulator YesN
MLKLLIADDESMTREGIIDRISWSELGISSIMQAEDGLNGLEICTSFEPDIVLTDVRMPRMNGIEMSTRLRAIYPDCKIVFMSGYSDKEYLKSAIQLKAISYVEKPINIGELKETLRQAVSQCRDDYKRKQNDRVLLQKIQSSIPLVKSELALELISKSPDKKIIDDRLGVASLDIDTNAFFVTILVRILSIKPSFSGGINSIKSELFRTLEHICTKTGVMWIAALKDDRDFVLHLYGENHFLSPGKQSYLCKCIYESLKPAGSFFIAVGKKERGIENVHNSYKSSLMALRYGFYRGYDSIIPHTEEVLTVFTFDEKHLRDFVELIVAERETQSIFYIKNLVSDIRRFENTEPRDVKDFFYKLLLELGKMAKHRELELFEAYGRENLLWEFLKSCSILEEIESFVLRKIEDLFKQLSTLRDNGSTINRILKFIKSNYGDPELSVDKLGRSINLAPTYMCALFKEKTGKTLNNYITEYRLEKAKEHLRDNTLRVSSIASLVGYRDGNYFSKLFRKATGFTPSEYRERSSL